MHTQLVNLGFVKLGGGRYRSAELGVTVTINAADPLKIDVLDVTGQILTITIDELEKAIMEGFGGN